MENWFLMDEMLLYFDSNKKYYAKYNEYLNLGLLTDYSQITSIEFPNQALGRQHTTLKRILAEVENKNVEQIVVNIDRQANHEWNTTRIVKFKPENYRNMLVKVENLGMINNNRMMITWKGDLKINDVQWIIE
jgi:hypothetical protein